MCLSLKVHTVRVWNTLHHSCIAGHFDDGMYNSLWEICLSHYMWILATTITCWKWLSRDEDFDMTRVPPRFSDPNLLPLPQTIVCTPKNNFRMLPSRLWIPKAVAWSGLPAMLWATGLQAVLWIWAEENHICSFLGFWSQVALHSCGELVSSHEEDSPWLVWEFPLLLAPRSTDRQWKKWQGSFGSFVRRWQLLLPWDLCWRVNHLWVTSTSTTVTS